MGDEAILYSQGKISLVKRVVISQEAHLCAGTHDYTKEGFPLITKPIRVEALACGKPVLISDQVNIWREVSEAQAGYICEDNEEAVYESLKKIVTTKEKLSDCSTTLFYDRFIVGKAAQKLVYMLT